MANPGMGTDQSMSDLSLTSSHPHYPTLSNPGDQSMSYLPFTSSQLHSTLGDPGHQSMDLSLPPQDPTETHMSHSFWSDLNNLMDDNLMGDFDEFAYGDVSGLLGDANSLLTPAGSLPAGHLASSSATAGWDHPPHLKSACARGFNQPDTGTYEAGNPDPIQRYIGEYQTVLGWLSTKSYQQEAFLIRDIGDALGYFDWLSNNGITDDGKDRFVHPQDPPTSRPGRYITRFLSRLEGYWKEKHVKAIRDPSAPRNIIGLKRTLEYINGGKRKQHLLADEYVALQPCGDGGVQIRDEIAVRTVYEEGAETAPPSSKCSRNDAHSHSSGESYIWQYMTKVFVKGDSETAALSLLYGICHECDKALKCPRSFGNGNLNKHLERVHDIFSPCKSQHVMTSKGGASVLRV